MRAGGLAPGDRVLMLARNCAGYVETLFACWRAGLVAVPVNAKLHAKEAAFIAEDSGSRWAFVDEAWRADVPPHERVIVLGSSEHEAMAALDASPDVADVARDAPAWLFYTSGTTGRPKGVMITHGNLAAMTQCIPLRRRGDRAAATRSCTPRRCRTAPASTSLPHVAHAAR